MSLVHLPLDICLVAWKYLMTGEHMSLFSGCMGTHIILKDSVEGTPEPTVCPVNSVVDILQKLSLPMVTWLFSLYTSSMLWFYFWHLFLLQPWQFLILFFHFSQMLLCYFYSWTKVYCVHIAPFHCLVSFFRPIDQFIHTSTPNGHLSFHLPLNYINLNF